MSNRSAPNLLGCIEDRRAYGPPEAVHGANSEAAVVPSSSRHDNLSPVRKSCGQRRHCPYHPNLVIRSEEHTSELQSRLHLVCRLLLEKKKNTLAVGPTRALPATIRPNTYIKSSGMSSHQVRHDKRSQSLTVSPRTRYGLLTCCHAQQ